MSTPSPIFVSTSRPGLLASLALTMNDFVEGVKQRETWLFMGWREVRKHYQRSVIGPFWLTLNMGFLIFGLGFLYSQIFKQEINEYLPFLALGFIMWALIGNVINEACTIFSSVATTIKQVRMPLSLHIFQFMWKHVITFLHNITIFVILALIFGIWPGINGLLFIPAMAMLLLNGIWCAMILGPVSARFRDIPPIVSSFTQVCFFMTPIFWNPTALPERALFLNLNPFYHFMEISRQPLLGNTATLTNWTVCVTITAGLGIFAILFFSRFRARIAYWA